MAKPKARAAKVQSPPPEARRKPYNGNTRRLLLAFDIGTTFSGISYRHVYSYDYYFSSINALLSILDPGKVPEIRTVTRYPAQEHVGGDSKIPSVIYYNPQGVPVAVGAETLKEGIEADAEDGGWVKSHWWKLHLRPVQAIPTAKETTIPVPPLPKGKTVVDVFTDYMRYLHSCAKKYISETHSDKVWQSLEGNIVYVLTHPNGWGGPQQAQMRRAAMLAGLVPDTPEGAGRVSFVTEGEASLHFCLSNGLSEEERDSGILIVDAGGGTIDLTAYKRCYFQGSAYVTMRAERHFKQLLTGTRFAADVDTLTTRFDRSTKHVFKRDDEPHHIQFAAHRERDPALNIRGGRLTIAGEQVAKFFEPSVSSIIVAVKKQHTNAHFPIKTVFLVGGFSASNWLYEKVREGVDCLGVTVSRPDTHVNKAVSDGAVSFYLDGVVSSRVARSTYGIEVFQKYDAARADHLARSRSIEIHDSTGEPVLYGAFSPILYRNTTVKAATEYRSGFRTRSTDRDVLKKKTLTIYSFNGPPPPEGENSWITDDPAKFPPVCRVEGDTSAVAIQEKKNAAGKTYWEMSFDVVLLFGLTELKAQIAWENEEGEEMKGPATVIFEGAVIE